MKLYLTLALFCISYNLFAQSSSFTTFKIIPSKEIVNAGDTIDYQIVTKNFKNVVGAQCGLTWDTNSIKIISSISELNKSLNPNLYLNGGQSFNINKNNILFVLVISNLDGISLGNQDSVLFTFRTVALKDNANTIVCFSDKLISSELVYYNDKGETVEPSGKIVNCNEVKFDPQQLILYSNNIVVFTQFTKSIKLAYTTKNGYPPIHSDWGIAKDQDSIVIAPPTQDTIYNLKVWDATNDTIFYQYNLVFKKVVITANFYQEYVDIKDEKKIKLSLDYNYYNGNVTIDWGTIKNVKSIIIDQPTMDSTYNVVIYDDTDTIKHTFFLKPFRAIFVKEVKYTSIIPFDESKMGLKVYLGTFGLIPPIKYSCQGAIKIDSNLILLPSDDETYVINAEDNIGNKLAFSIVAHKFKPILTIIGNKRPLIDQSNIYLYHYNALANYPKPIKYLWQNGDTSYVSNFKRPLKDSTYYSLSIVDANGLAIRDSIQIIFNNNAYCFGNLKYENKVLSTNFNKNPLFGLVNWNYEIVQSNKIILSKKGSTVEGFLKVDFDNQSLTDTAFFTLKFSMKGQNYDIAEQMITYKIPPKSGFPLAIKNSKEYRFCSLDSSIVLKSAVIGGTPPLTYNWSNGASGEELDSIVVKPTQTTKYSVTVVDAAGKSIVNEIKVNIGDSLKLYSIVLPDSICPKNISIPINANNTNAPFELFTMLEKNDGTFEYDTIVHSSSKTFINYDVQNYSNQNYEKLVVKLKVPQNGYCLDNTLVEASDTVILKPTPKFQDRTPIKKSICFNDAIQIDLPLADTSNLKGAKISYKNFNWINDITEGNIVYKIDQGDSRVNYISNPEFPAHYQDVNYYFLNQFRWNIKYDFNDCDGFDIKMDDSIFTIKHIFLQLYSKYQTINSGQEIQPIKTWTTYNVLNYQWQFSDNQLSGSLFNCTTNPLKGNLVNKKDYTQLLKIYINGEIEGCKTTQDTAYIQVNSLYAPALHQLETSDVFIEGHRIARKITEISENQLDVSFAPNPVQDKIYIKLDLKSDQQSEFIIYSVEGKIIAQFSEPCNAGRNRIEIQTANLQSGAYIMEIRNKEGNQVIKFIKE